MNNKCNNCAKFLTCNRKECKKITFVEAGILDKPKNIKRSSKSFEITMQEAEENLRKAMQRLSMQTSQYSK